MKIKKILYRCDNCGYTHSHKNSYSDEYCYDCIDIDTGKLKVPNIRKTNVSLDKEGNI